MRPIKILLLLILAGLLLPSCRYHHPELSENWDMTDDQRDSLTFALTHHYSENFNFTVTSDSLTLLSQTPMEVLDMKIGDSCAVRKGDKLVVADVMSVPSDTASVIWVKVARDQETMGWICESQLLRDVVPCDPISQFIHAFSNRHLFALYLFAGLGALLYFYRFVRRKRMPVIHFNDIQSLYPTLFCIVTASAAVLYGSMQRFVPDTWQEFYFHPTLNPFGQPLILFLFLAHVWLMVILAIATLDDVRKQLRGSEAIGYLVTLICACLVLYIFFSLSVHIYIGYPFFAAYCFFAIYTYLHHLTARYICGQCGRPISRLGRCPHCGAINK